MQNHINKKNEHNPYALEEQHMREDNPYAVGSFSTGGLFDAFGGSGSGSGADSADTKRVVDSITRELVELREARVELEHELADLRGHYNKLERSFGDLQEKNTALAMLTGSDTWDTKYKIVSITGVMLATTDEYHGEIKKIQMVPHSKVNGDYLRTSESINGHRVYVKIRGAPTNVNVDGFGGQLCIWKSPTKPTEWLVGEPRFYPNDMFIAKIEAPVGGERWDLVELVGLAEEQGTLLNVRVHGHRHGEEVMRSKFQKNACIRVKNIQAVMADLLADADTYAQRLRFNETTFECGLCGDETRFRHSMIAPCGHVFCKNCYLDWLKKSPHGKDTVCPNGCPVPFIHRYTPYTFPIEMTLMYVKHGNVKDLEAKEAAAAAAAAAAAVEAKIPPPGKYDASTWLKACGFDDMLTRQIISQIIEKLGREDVWTLLDVGEYDMALRRWEKRELDRAQVALREARESGAIAEDGTLSG